ncbi:MAG: hypothetical protein IJ466_07370 [Clostridia bacterium]|nr:hypothetical protein [Clostridia bacterium]
MERIEITFDGRTPVLTPPVIGIGLEGDRNAMELCITVPEIADVQIATLNIIFPDETPDAIPIPEDGIIPVDEALTRCPGSLKTWVELSSEKGKVIWHSYTWRMYICDLPDMEELLAQKDPTIMQRMAQATLAADAAESQRAEAFSQLKLVTRRVDEGVLVEATSVDGTVTYALWEDGDDPSAKPGKDGEDGGYYTPRVENGVLIWTPSKENMPELPVADITGPPGDPGHTPEKGIDYFTDEEKAEIAAEAAALAQENLPAIDPDCYFTSYDAAMAAALAAQELGADAPYFYGQRLLVFENNRATWYTIQPGGELSQEGGGAGEEDSGGTAVEFGPDGGSTAEDSETAVEF